MYLNQNSKKFMKMHGIFPHFAQLYRSNLLAHYIIIPSAEILFYSIWILTGTSILMNSSSHLSGTDGSTEMWI